MKNTQYSRISLHGISGASATFSVPTQEDFTLGWNSNGTELLNKEIGVNTTDNKAYMRIGSTINQITFGVPSYVPTADAVIYTVKIGLSVGNILSLNTTPILVVAAPGVNNYIEVVSASSYINYSSIAYATNTDLVLGCSASVSYQMYSVEILASTVSRGARFLAQAAAGTTNTQLVTNQPLLVKVLTGNPTAGNSSIILNVAYRIVNITAI